MSQSPEQLARRALALLGGDDAEVLVGFCDAEVVCRPLIAGVEGGEYGGHSGIRRWFDELASSFDERRARIVSIETVAPDAALCEVDLHMRGRGSGIEIDQTVYGAGRYRNGLVLWWGFFEGRDEALRELEQHPA
ncbi:MAG: nuclear transport factor 2 family protein [Solirubrobacterales bacterium]